MASVGERSRRWPGSTFRSGAHQLVEVTVAAATGVHWSAIGLLRALRYRLAGESGRRRSRAADHERRPCRPRISKPPLRSTRTRREYRLLVLGGEPVKIGVFVTVGHPGSDRALPRSGGARRRGARLRLALGRRARRALRRVRVALSVRRGRPHPGRRRRRHARAVHRALLPRRRCTDADPARHRHLPGAAAQSGLHREGGRRRRLAVGRPLDFGVGVGWLAEEFQALGVPFERRGERCRDLPRGDEARSGATTSRRTTGEFYTLPACRQYPKPVQTPHPPIHFGGESDAALRRVAESVRAGTASTSTPPD